MPYRIAAEQTREPRPLEPEDEMRLLLEQAELPGGRRLWTLRIVTVLGLGALMCAWFYPEAASFVPYLLFPALSFLYARFRHRRRIERLRAAGFEVDEQKLRVASTVLPERARVEDALDPPDEGDAALEVSARR